jgi:hypothetical protein
MGHTRSGSRGRSTFRVRGVETARRPAAGSSARCRTSTASRSGAARCSGRGRAGKRGGRSARPGGRSGRGKAALSTWAYYGSGRSGGKQESAGCCATPGAPATIRDQGDGGSDSTSSCPSCWPVRPSPLLDLRRRGRTRRPCSPPHRPGTSPSEGTSSGDRRPREAGAAVTGSCRRTNWSTRRFDAHPTTRQDFRLPALKGHRSGCLARSFHRPRPPHLSGTTCSRGSWRILRTSRLLGS